MGNFHTNLQSACKWAIYIKLHGFTRLAQTRQFKNQFIFGLFLHRLGGLKKLYLV